MISDPLTHDGAICHGTAVPSYRRTVTSRPGSVVVSRCICKATTFESLLQLARSSHWDLNDLIRETGAGGQCGLCRPYLSRMLRTGETEFHELLSPEDG